MGKYTKKQKKTLYVSLGTSFITTFMGSALNLSIPDMERFFGVSAAQIGWVVTVYMLTCAALAVPFGYLADRGKREKMLRLGMVLFAGACTGAAFTGSLKVILLLRLVQGAGASLIFCTNIAILAASFDANQRGKILGWSACSNYAGLSAGPVLGGIINNFLGWQAVFIFGGLITAAVIPAAFSGKDEKCTERLNDEEKKEKVGGGNKLY